MDIHSIRSKIWSEFSLDGEAASITVKWWVFLTLLPILVALVAEYSRELFHNNGRIRVLTHDSQQELDPGDTYVISADIEHSIEIMQDAREVQVFTPARKDFR